MGWGGGYVIRQNKCGRRLWMTHNTNNRRHKKLATDAANVDPITLPIAEYFACYAFQSARICLDKHID